MQNNITMPLPNELSNPFFIPPGPLNVPPAPKEFQLSWNFLYEAYFYNGFDVFKPWENSKSVIPKLLEKWNDLKEQLEKMYRKRDDAGALEHMKKGIGIYVQFLFWSNELPVALLEPFPWDKFKYKPVNIEERYNFIVSRPKLFPSFRQLSEIMEEQEKLFAKKNIIKKDVQP